MKVFGIKSNYLSVKLEILGIKFVFNKKSKNKIDENYENVLNRLKNKYGKEKIKVGFLVSEQAKWKYQSLYEKLLEDDCFEPVVLVTELSARHKNKKSFYKTIEECYEFFKNKKMNVVYAYDVKKRKYISLDEFGIDILFYQQPWMLGKEQKPDMVSRYALTCYSCYGLNIVEDSIDYMEDFHFLLWKMFVENECLVSCFSNLIKKEIYNCVTVGCPMLDEYKKVTDFEDKNKPIIIYAPHHSLDEKGLRCATFNHNGKKILELAKNTKDMFDWVFKPHPRLKHAVICNNIMKEEEIDEYFEEWRRVGRIVDGGDYINLFYNSDAMITDCVSFLGEYLPSKKPLIHLVSDFNPFNDFGKSFIDSFYKAHDFEEFSQIFNEVVVLKNDYKRDERLDKIKILYDEKTTVTDKIYNFLNDNIRN